MDVDKGLAVVQNGVDAVQGLSLLRGQGVQGRNGRQCSFLVGDGHGRCET